VLEVYIGKRKAAGVYVKVFGEHTTGRRFYRDGYTDITGSFRYALSDIDGISAFSILVQTEKGGLIQRVNAPTKLAAYQVLPNRSSKQKSLQKKK
jgi:hypothetical protein